MDIKPAQKAAVIVAHPDDEALWCGGLILSNPETDWFIASCCRKSDPDRSTKFFRALKVYGANGAMADLDDGPDQTPLDPEELQKTVVNLIPAAHYDLVLTHALDGEYTRHRRHEEVSQAVMGLWSTGAIITDELWLFAYQDGESRIPKAIETADQYTLLPDTIWQQKLHLIVGVYGFRPDSWEAVITPKAEAFWRFRSAIELKERESEVSVRS